LGFDGVSKGVSAAEFAAARTVSSDEVGVAKLADGSTAIGFASGPQIAGCEAAEYGGAAGVGALTLQGVKDFLDLVHR
jgi:hypothetical protein